MSHWQSQSTSTTADKYFSEMIRRRDNRCVYATPRCKNWTRWQELTCSHFISRRYQSVRYDEANCDAACRSCHQWVQDTPEGMAWLVEFKKQQLGESGFNGLLFRKQQIVKRDDKLANLVTKQMLKDILASG